MFPPDFSFFKMLCSEKEKDFLTFLLILWKKMYNFEF